MLKYIMNWHVTIGGGQFHSIDRGGVSHMIHISTYAVRDLLGLCVET